MEQSSLLFLRRKYYVYLDRKFFFNILASFAHSKLVEYEGKKNNVRNYVFPAKCSHGIEV
jgi:hypothetical protein